MSDEKDMLLIPCKRCGHQPLEMHGIGQRRYFCAHCCHEFEKTVSAPGRSSEAEAIAAWNAMQLDPPIEDDAKSSLAELLDVEFRQIFDKMQAIGMAAKSAKYCCGNSHTAAVCDYIISEAAVMQDLLYDIKREIEKRSKNE